MDRALNGIQFWVVHLKAQCWALICFYYSSTTFRKKSLVLLGFLLMIACYTAQLTHQMMKSFFKKTLTLWSSGLTDGVCSLILPNANPCVFPGRGLQVKHPTTSMVFLSKKPKRLSTWASKSKTIYAGTAILTTQPPRLQGFWTSSGVISIIAHLPSRKSCISHWLGHTWNTLLLHGILTLSKNISSIERISEASSTFCYQHLRQRI